MPDVTLPSLGESVVEGIVTKWFKSIGDHVERDEPLYEISTDKVDSEMPAPAAGVLTEILVPEGETVEVGARLAVIADGAAPSAAPTAPPPPPPAATAPEPAPSTAPAAPPTTVPPPASVPATPSPGDVGVTSPVVRRILADAGLDATRVAGTGPGGTVTRKDAERAVATGPVDDVVVPMTNARRRMADHMAESVATSPHAFVAVEADATAIARMRALGDRTIDGVAVDPVTVVAVAVVRALGEFELLNASVADDGVVVHRGVNLGIAIALDDGMLVPVIHAAGGLTLRALARRVADLEARTATRQLTTDDLMGATITISGPPSRHALFSIPILIQPQVAIVSVGAPMSGPSLLAGAATHDHVVLGCSFDHRVVDATYVGRFLDRVAELLAGLDVDSER